MANDAAYVVKLAAWLGQALASSRTAFAEFSTEGLGTKLPDSVVKSQPVADAVQQVVTAGAVLEESSAQINAASVAADEAEIIASLVAFGTALGQFFQSLANLCNRIRAAITPVTIPDANDRAAAQDLTENLERKLADLLIITVLLDTIPHFTVLLKLMGLVELGRKPADPGNTLSRSYVAKSLRLDRLKDLISDPVAHFQTSLRWGANDFDPSDFFNIYLDFFNEEDHITFQTVDGDPVLQHGPITVRRVSDHLPPGLRIEWEDSVTGHEAFRAAFTEAWGVGFASNIAFGAGASARIDPPASITIQAAGEVAGEFRLFIDRNENARPFDVFAGGLLTLSVNNASIGLQLNAGWNSSTGRAEVTPLVFSEISGAKLRLGSKDADGFVASLLASSNIEGQFDLGLEWQPEGGLRIRASGGVEIALPIHKRLGPVDFQTLYLALRIRSDGTLSLEASAALVGRLGPLIAVLDRIGAQLDLRFVEGTDGDFGPFDLNLGFKPPNGVGLSLDAGGFKGGGFLMLDNEKGEYAGALELDFKGLFSLKAIGIVNTKMPDGSKGFSLLIVIAAEFTPIQLSFGFTLNGVGGIFGLNRTIVVAALAEGIRTNAVKSILFPENVIANISRIISDIKQFFPQKQDHFVIGPMAKLGWASIITVELGLLLDLPDPMFAIVGVLKAVLPEEEAPVLRLQVNFLGVVDFDRGYIFFRADLFDSRLLVYSITGSMAFLVSWGEAKALALSVGGFHPDFRDIPSIPALPDGFRSMARIGISLLSDDNPRLKVESYFAVTANTLQFGARVELYAEEAGFNLYGFLGYDVLFQRDPFRFVAKLSGGIALRRHSSVIAGVNISATLSGPAPWDARGKATLEFLFFSISVGFHANWGDLLKAIAGAIEDLLTLLQRELADTRNWRADLPPNNHLHVSVRKIELPAATDMLVIHPAGVLTFSQRSLPLEDFSIAKFGTRKPLAENKFKITNANSRNAEIPADYQGVREQFAPANFLELSDSEKLSRKSFDNLPSGFKLTATSDLLTTLPVVRSVNYELSYLRGARIVPKGLIKFFVLAYDRLVKGSAVRQSGLAQQQKRISLNAPPQVGLPQETFAIANAADLRSHVANASGPVFFATQAEAYQQQQELIAQNPALAGQVQVVSHFELNLN